jgi:pilus assembly protein CpaB
VFEQAIATLELDPLQGETVINASKVGTLSLALRSITDFAAETSPQVRRASNQAVRMIRFGQESNVMAGRPTQQLEEPAPVTIDPAVFAAPGAAVPAPPPMPTGNEPVPVRQ